MTRPNILLLFTDQQRADTLHAAGNPIIKIPNLDRLAGEGVLFESAYTPSPVCVPARCALIYGQYPRHTDNPDDMPDDRPSMMDLLAEAVRVLPIHHAAHRPIIDPLSFATASDNYLQA